MRKYLTAALLGSALLSASALADTPVSHTNAIQPVVVKAGKSSYLSVSLTRVPLDYGTITTLTATTVSDAGANYTGLTGALSLQVISGANRGKTVEVTAASGPNLTVSEDLTAVAAVGDEFILFQDWTLDTLLGNPGTGGSPSGLVGGSGFSSSTIDNVQIVNPATGGVTTYWYKTTAPAGWRTTSNPVTNVGNARIPLNSGIIVNRVTAGDVTIDLKGAVRVGRQSATLKRPGGGHSGFNILSIHNPAGVTLANSGLSSVITGGSGFSTANTDQVYVKDANGNTNIYWFKTSAPSGWRLTNNPVTSQNNVLIPPGTAILVRRAPVGTDTVYHQNQTITP